MTENDLQVPESNRAVSRNGNPNRYRQALVQLLQASYRKTGYFVAVLRDPETREIMREVELWRPKPGECADLLVEWQPEPDGRR
jgi:hypothetical protein